MKKWIIIITTIFLLAILAAGFWTYKTFFYTTPLTQQELKGLTPDWTKATNGNWSPWHTEPDGTKTWNPAASFNDWVADIPKHDKAWPTLIDIRYENWDLVLNQSIGSTPEDGEYWDEVIELLKLQDIQKIITQYSELLQRPYMGCGLYNGTWTRMAGDPVSTTRKTRDPDEFAAMKQHGVDSAELVGNGVANLDLRSVDLSPAGMLRSIANLLTSDAYYEFLNGNQDRFVELQDIISMSTRFSDEFPSYLYQLASLSIEGQSNGSIHWALNQSTKFNEAQLVNLDKILARHENRSLLWEGESLEFHDTVRRLVNSNGKLISHDYENRVGDLIGKQFNGTDLELDPSVQSLIMVHDSKQKLLSLSISPSEQDLTDEINVFVNRERPLLNRRAELLLSHQISTLSLIRDDFVKHRFESRELRMKIATQRHTLRHASPPASQSDIDPDLLPN